MTLTSESVINKQAKYSDIIKMNKKFELMFMRRAKAYSSSCWQTVGLISSHFTVTFTGVPLFNGLVRRFLNIENQDLDHKNLGSMLKISYAASPCLSPLVSVQFALEMCLTARNRQKNP